MIINKKPTQSVSYVHIGQGLCHEKIPSPPRPACPRLLSFLCSNRFTSKFLFHEEINHPSDPPPSLLPSFPPPGVDLFLVLHSPALLEIFALPEGSDVEGTVLVSVGASAVDGQHLLLLEREKGRGMLSLNAFTASWKPVSGDNIYLELV